MTSRRPLLLATRGLPASGKTTWALEAAGAQPAGQVKTVNLDDLRASFDRSHWDQGSERLVQDAQLAYVVAAIEAGHDVIVHNTHVTARPVNRLRRETAMMCDLLIVDFASVGIDVCIERDAQRVGRANVGPEVIEKLDRRLKGGRDGWGGHHFVTPAEARLLLDTGRPLPAPHLRYTPDPSLPAACIVDLDGTLAKHQGRDPYDASRCGEDLFDQVVWTAASAYPNVVFLSGRSEEFRPQTEDWLLRHLSGRPSELHMRAADDLRPDSIVKLELFVQQVAPRYNVQVAFDDRNSVVRMWRRLGLPCFHVAEGAF